MTSSLVTRAGQRALRRFGYRLERVGPREPVDLPPEDVDLYRAVEAHTMTSPEAVYALASAVRYVTHNAVPGAVVECGVWRGGSMMAAARTLLELGRNDVPLHLFDTFEGMSEPTEKDVRWTGESAEQLLATETGPAADLLWARCSLDDVRSAMASVPYPPTSFISCRGGSRTRCRTRPPTASRSCAWTPTGTSRRGASSCTCIRASRRAVC